MSHSFIQFNQRVNRIDRMHRDLSRGSVARIRPDGLIVIQPYRPSFHIPAKAVIILVLALLGFKGFLLANIGPDGYRDRVELLSEGTIVEQAGAWVMQIDPVSKMIANKIGPIMR